MTKAWLFTLALLVAIGAAGCAKDVDPGDDTPDEPFGEIAVSSLSGSVAAVGGGNSAAFHEARPLATLFAALQRLLSPIPPAFAATACPRFSESQCVTPDELQSVYVHCQFTGPDGNPDRAIWDGMQIIRFTNGARCGQSGYLTGSATRSFRPGTTRLSDQGVRVTFDSANRKGWRRTVTGGTTINFLGAASRTIVINGIHYVGTHLHKTHQNNDVTATVIDHSVSTISPIHSELVNGQRILTSGTMQTQNNIDHSTGTSTITAELRFTPACCHPIAGQLTTEISGSKAGTEVLTFNGNCSTADLTDRSGATRLIHLSHCL